jgi:hypothetical protein
VVSREEGRKRVETLVPQFRENYRERVRSNSTYNETQLRNDFINPFLEALGWDVFNQAGAPQALREVIQEDVVEVEDERGLLSKKPDYALRLAGERRFFVEAKKPAEAIDTKKQWAFQVRRYGWSARLPISVLTNFDNLIIYDCRWRPKLDQDVSFGRRKLYNYTEYVDKFDEIYDQLSREVVYSGQFDAALKVGTEQVGTEPFDQYFLAQIERWRKKLAEDLIQRNPQLTQEELNFLVQRLLNRIIFLRICEDRELENYQTLKGIQTYEELKALFIQADQRYNACLFDLIEDQLSSTVEVGSDALVSIFQELYYPESPYAFSVVEAGVLGEIYELFLAQEIQLGQDNRVKVVEKPEVVASSGIVPTPGFIVDAIIQRTLASLCIGKSPSDLADIRVADIACGSGTFLLAAFEYLLNHTLEWYLRDGAEKHSDKVYEGASNEWSLALNEKQRILVSNIHGVDIDPRAVEVTRFSLLLKALENESAAAIKAHLDKYNLRALPNLSRNIQCGNSLIDKTYFDYDENALASDEFERINPFDWKGGFENILDECSDP